MSPSTTSFLDFVCSVDRYTDKNDFVATRPTMKVVRPKTTRPSIRRENVKLFYREEPTYRQITSTYLELPSTE
jgi:hypothetical protein